MIHLTAHLQYLIYMWSGGILAVLIHFATWWLAIWSGSLFVKNGEKLEGIFCLAYVGFLISDYIKLYQALVAEGIL